MLSTNIPSNWPIYEISSFLFFLLPMLVILILYIRMGIAIRESGADDSMKRLQGLVHKPRHSNSRKSIIRMLGKFYYYYRLQQHHFFLPAVIIVVFIILH